jgi:hypothetical protein
MFEQIAGSAYSFGSWLTQLLAVFIVPMLLWAVLNIALNLQDTLIPQLFGYAFLAVISVGLAFAVSLANHHWTKAGAWIWVLPVAVEIWGIYSEVSLGTPVGDFFLIPGPGRGEEGWGVLITLPTWSCCCYSATMWLRLRQSQRQAYGKASTTI